MSVGALEPQFFANLLHGLDLKPEDVGSALFPREDSRSWPSMHLIFEARFKQKTRQEWELIFDKLDACVVPVLEHSEMEESGYQHRPLVHLQSSPAKEVTAPWNSQVLEPGTKGEKVLNDWMKWEKGEHYIIGDGKIFSAIARSRL